MSNPYRVFMEMAMALTLFVLLAILSTAQPAAAGSPGDSTTQRNLAMQQSQPRGAASPPIPSDTPTAIAAVTDTPTPPPTPSNSPTGTDTAASTNTPSPYPTPYPTCGPDSCPHLYATLAVTSVTTNSIGLHATADFIPGDTGIFDFYRSVAGGESIYIGTVYGVDADFIDRNLTCVSYYTYYAHVTEPAGYHRSSNTNIVSATLASCPTTTPIPSATGTPPTASPTPCGIADLVVNGGFETGNFAAWVISDTNPAPIISNDPVHSGGEAATLGSDQPGRPGDSSIYQTISVPADGGILSFWYWPSVGGFHSPTDYSSQDAYIENTSGAIIAVVMSRIENDQIWKNVTFDMTPFAGQTVRLAFLVRLDHFGYGLSMIVDDISMLAPVPCDTPTATVTGIPPTDTPTVTGTLPTATPTFTPQPTDCANPYVDIEYNIFFHAINYLYCNGVVSGTDGLHYSPADTATRGQFAKVVIMGFGIPLYTPTSGQDFNDVAASYFAFVYIETGYYWDILNGFDPGICRAHGVQPPCYLPNLAITRGQLTKLVVNAGHYLQYTPGTPHFTDVPPSNVFYVSIETAYHNNVIAGYPDHTFRPNNNIRRDEMAQIVYEGIVHRL